MSSALLLVGARSVSFTYVRAALHAALPTVLRYDPYSAPCNTAHAATWSYNVSSLLHSLLLVVPSSLVLSSLVCARRSLPPPRVFTSWLRTLGHTRPSHARARSLSPLLLLAILLPFFTSSSSFLCTTCIPYFFGPRHQLVGVITLSILPLGSHVYILPLLLSLAH